MRYWWNYIKYFFFLGWNWNFRLAAFILWHDIKGEKKYHSYTTLIDDLSDSIDEQDWMHASIYQPVNFYTIHQLFAHITEADKQSAFIDIGCGMGRLFSVAAAFGFRKIYGVDLSPVMVEDAEVQAVFLEQHYPNARFEIEEANAATYEVPADAGVLFLFNPFDHTVMEPFVTRLTEQLQSNPRPIKVLYANPVCKEIWLNAGFKEVFHFRKLKYLEGSVLIYEP
jgi:SAM-dependent methyltransferase